MKLKIDIAKLSLKNWDWKNEIEKSELKNWDW